MLTNACRELVFAVTPLPWSWLHQHRRTRVWTPNQRVQSVARSTHKRAYSHVQRVLYMQKSVHIEPWLVVIEQEAIARGTRGRSRRRSTFTPT